MLLYIVHVFSLQNLWRFDICFPCSSFDELLELSQKGDNGTIDMLVGDIYGGMDYSKVHWMQIQFPCVSVFLFKFVSLLQHVVLVKVCRMLFFCLFDWYYYCFPALLCHNMWIIVEWLFFMLSVSKNLLFFILFYWSRLVSLRQRLHLVLARPSQWTRSLKTTDQKISHCLSCEWSRITLDRSVLHWKKYFRFLRI